MNLCYRVNLLSAYQCLKIYFIYISLQRIVINFLDQSVISLTGNFQHNLATFVFDFQNFFYFTFIKFQWNRIFQFTTKQVSCYKSFAS